MGIRVSDALSVPRLSARSVSGSGFWAARRVDTVHGYTARVVRDTCRQSCRVSAGIGVILVEKQTMTCTFTPAGGGPVSYFTGQIVEYGVALGAVEKGNLLWGVIAATDGVQPGALAGTYAGVGADASAGIGLGANVLVGGTGRAFSLQPLSVEGEVGINVAAGVTTLTLTSAS